MCATIITLDHHREQARAKTGGKDPQQFAELAARLVQNTRAKLDTTDPKNTKLIQFLNGVAPSPCDCGHWVPQTQGPSRWWCHTRMKYIDRPHILLPAQNHRAMKRKHTPLAAHFAPAQTRTEPSNAKP